MPFWNKYAPVAAIGVVVFLLLAWVLPTIAPGLQDVGVTMRWMIYGVCMLVWVGLVISNLALLAVATPAWMRRIILPPEQWSPPSHRELHPNWKTQRWAVAGIYALWINFVLLGCGIFSGMPERLDAWRINEWRDALVIVAGLWLVPLIVRGLLRLQTKTKKAGLQVPEM